jgi:serine/threonine protein kinase
VSDFGLSQIKKVKAEGRKSGVKTSTDGEDEEGEEDGGVGSLLWAAPEVLAGGRGDEKADVYAYGVMLWELLHWSEPFPGVAALKVRRIVYNIQCIEIFTLRMEKLHTEA